MTLSAVALSLAALQGATAFIGGAAPARFGRTAPVTMETATAREWDMRSISTPDGSPVQRIEGQTRKTWKFNDIGKDRVQVALESEGRPVHADIQLWIGPDWTPFSLKVRRRARRSSSSSLRLQPYSSDCADPLLTFRRRRKPRRLPLSLLSPPFPSRASPRSRRRTRKTARRARSRRSSARATSRR